VKPNETCDHVGLRYRFTQPTYSTILGLPRHYFLTPDEGKVALLSAVRYNIRQISADKQRQLTK